MGIPVSCVIPDRKRGYPPSHGPSPSNCGSTYSGVESSLRKEGVWRERSLVGVITTASSVQGVSVDMEARVRKIARTDLAASRRHGRGREARRQSLAQLRRCHPRRSSPHASPSPKNKHHPQLEPPVRFESIYSREGRQAPISVTRPALRCGL